MACRQGAERGIPVPLRRPSGQGGQGPVDGGGGGGGGALGTAGAGSGRPDGAGAEVRRGSPARGARARPPTGSGHQVGTGGRGVRACGECGECRRTARRCTRRRHVGRPAAGVRSVGHRLRRHSPPRRRFRAAASRGARRRTRLDGGPSASSGRRPWRGSGHGSRRPASTRGLSSGPCIAAGASSPEPWASVRSGASCRPARRRRASMAACRATRCGSDRRSPLRNATRAWWRCSSREGGRRRRCRPATRESRRPSAAPWPACATASNLQARDSPAKKVRNWGCIRIFRRANVRKREFSDSNFVSRTKIVVLSVSFWGVVDIGVVRRQSMRPMCGSRIPQQPR